MELVNLKIKFMEYVFFIKNMNPCYVVVENLGFRLDMPISHIHVEYSDDITYLKNELNRMRDFIVLSHDFYEENAEIETHESLSKKGIDSSSFMSSTLKKKYKMLVSQKIRNQYLSDIDKIKNDIK